MFSSTPTLSSPLVSSKLGTAGLTLGSTHLSRLVCWPFLVGGTSTGFAPSSFSTSVAGLE
jgi:hypothetical protein